MSLKFLFRGTLSIALAIAITLSGFPAKVSPPGTGLADGTAGAFLQGDITGDGLVSGKDALKIMRILEGFIPATEQDVALGDVHPFPGADGRAVGDGQLTREDAYRVLRYAVGLVSYPKLSGQLSAPLITKFHPTSGRAGVEVAITGGIFVPERPEDNAVDFSGVPAKVLGVTETEIRVQVPAEAITGPITVRTPAGRAVSRGDFTVPFSRTLQLRLPGGLNPQNYTVINPYGYAVPDESGRVSVLANPQGITFNSAVPGDPTERVFFQVDTLTPGAGEVLGVDALSTAKAMAFLSPYLFSPRVERAQLILAAMAEDPKVADLARVIEAVYPQVPNPVDDPRLATALREAILSVMNRLPAEYAVKLAPALRALVALNPMTAEGGTVPAPNIGGGAPPIPSASPGVGELPLSWKPIDPNMMGHSLAGPGKLKIESVGSNPLDWYIRLAELDPTQFTRGMQSIREIPEIPGGVTLTNLNRAFRRLPGTEPTLIVPASAFFENLDLIDNALDLMAPGPAPEPSQENTLPFNNERDAVYVVRMLNPALIWMWGTQESEWGFIPNVLPNGPEDAMKALAFNILMLVLDDVDIIEDADIVLKQDLVIDTFNRAVALLAYKFPNGLEGVSQIEFIYRIAEVFVMTMIEAGRRVTSEVAQLDGLELIARIGWLVGKTILTGMPINITGELDSVGSVGERLAYMVTGSGMGYSMSPLESLIFVVGDPFSPKITGFSPGEGIAGESVTISGERFLRGRAELPIVRFDGVGAVVKSATENQLTVEIPQRAGPGEVFISVETLAGRKRSPTPFRVKRQPAITTLTPDRGFPTVVGFPSPTSVFRGTTVVIEGSGFDRDSDVVTIGGVRIERGRISITQSSSTRLALDLPGGVATGPIEVTTPEGLKASGPVFSVLGPPILQTKAFEGPRGMLLVLPVLNLSGDPQEVKVELIQDSAVSPSTSLVHNDRQGITIMVPVWMTQGQIKVTTPAGSDTATFTARPELGKQLGGTITPNPGKDDLGSDPYHLSLREAIEAAAGRYVLWDDNDDEVTRTHYEERKRTLIDAQGNEQVEYYWVEVRTDVEPPKPAPGPKPVLNLGHEFRKHYDVYHDHPDHGGAERRVLERTEDLDSGQDQEHLPEEGDMVTSATGLPYIPGQATFDKILLRPPDTKGVRTFTLSLPGTLILGFSDEVGEGNLPQPSDNIIDATGTLGNDVLFELKDGNAIYDVEIRNARGVAIRMAAEAHDNVVDGVRISGAGDTAIHIGPGAHHNTISRGQITGMLGTGILITGEGSKFNSVVGTFVGGFIDRQGLAVIDGSDTGWGIVLSDGASYNTVGGGGYYYYAPGQYIASVADNKGGGILITGSGTEHNVVENYNVGFITSGLYSPVAYPAGNGGDGIRIAQGARFNHIGIGGEAGLGILSIGFNRGDGLVITGQGTSGNVKELHSSLTVGTDFFASQKDQGNSGHGIRISDGARDNRIDNFFSQHNGGYAVLIEGVGTDNNGVMNCTLGGADPGPGVGLKGQGGVAIRNGPKGSEVTRCMVGGTRGDAILLSNTGDAPQPNKVWNNTIGLTRRFKPDFTWEEVAWSDGRSGLRLESGAHHNILDMNRINYEPTAIVITGAGTSYNRLRFNRIKNSQSTGILVSEGADFNSIDSTLVFNSGQDGIGVDNAHNTSLLTVAVRQSAGNGIVLRNGSRNTVIASLTPPAVFIPTEDPMEMPETPIDVTWPEVSAGGGHGIVVESSSQNTLILNAAIFGNRGDGVLVQGLGTSATEISRSRIGVSISPAGSAAAAGNGGNGIHIAGGAVGVLLGGPTPAEGNVISANAQWGVLVSGSSSIQAFNNLIGTDPTGSTAWGNGGGVTIQDAATIAVGAPGMGNVISGNQGDGLYLSGAGTREVGIMNNLIGVNLSGAGAMGNQGDGIRVANGAARVVIGDDADNMRNIVSGNRGNGIRITDGATSDIRVVGNYIGPDAAGRMALENQASGVLLGQGVPNIAIGPGNVISGNRLSGVSVVDAGTNLNRIFGNLIGLSIDKRPLGNQVDGIHIANGASQNRVFQNFIWHNLGSGVTIGAGATGNTVTSGSISSNGGEGIALVAGGNGNLPSPWIVSYRSGLVQGEVDQTIPERTPVEVFADGGEEGMLPLGTAYVNRGRFILRAPVPWGARVTATVTDAWGNTSQFGGPKPPVRPPLIPIPPGPRIIPDKGRLVFTSTWGGNRDISIMDLRLALAERLTTAVEADHSPSLSPNGSRVLFVSERDGNPEIYTMGFDGSNLVRLTTNPAADYDPAWSPDGSKIVFVSEREGNPEIYLMDANGANPSRLTSEASIDRFPAWSHQGTKIAFISHRDGNSEIYVMEANGTGVIRLTNEPAADYQPAWSSDDSRLVFVSERDGNPEIYTMNANGTGLTRLTKNQAAEAHPSWLLGTDWIAFHSNLDGEAEIYAMTPDGMNIRRITVGFGMNMEPHWVLTASAAPQGSALAITGSPQAPVAHSITSTTSGATLTLRMESGKARPGSTVSQKVAVAGAQDLGNLAFDIVYDKSKLKLLGAAPGEIALAERALFALNPEVFPSSSGLVRFNWVRASGFSGAGDVLSLTFRVEDNAAQGAIPIAFLNPHATDVNLTDVSVAGQEGMLTILLAGDVNQNCVVDISDLTIVASTFHTVAGSTKYNPDADLNGDNVVDIRDLVKVAKNFGARCQ